jgi:hypothetical protein
MRRAVLAAVFLVIAGGLVIGQTQTTQAPAGRQTPPNMSSQPSAQPLKLPASPPGQSATQVGGKWVEPKPGAGLRYTDGKWIVVDYGRPILRGRKNIFGAGADYGRNVNAGAPVWRAGANVTTRLHTEVPLVVAGKTLPAGDYSLFVDLKPNNKTETWGAYNYDPKFDVMRVPMKVATATPSMDQFTIDFENMTDAGGTLAMRWEATVATVDFKVG